MTRINTNVSSLNAQKTLARSNAQLQEALTRLSTGLRINSGKDDPAGLIASEALRSDMVSTSTAISNSERANQMIATADSALGQVSSLLNDIRGLVSEAANEGAMSQEQIDANQLQVDASLDSIDRVAKVTQFQGKRLLDGSLDFITSGVTATQLTGVQINQANFGTQNQIAVGVNVVTQATQGQLSYNSSILTNDVVLEIGGSKGFEAFNFGVGSTVTDMMTAINLVSDALGVEAELADRVAETATQGQAKYGHLIPGTVGTDSANSFTITAATAGQFAGDYTVRVTKAAAGGATTAAWVPGSPNVIDLTVGTLAGANAASAVLDNSLGGTGTLTSLDANAPGAEYNNVKIQITTNNGLGANSASYNYATKTIVVSIVDDLILSLEDTINADLNNQFVIVTSGGVGTVAAGLYSDTGGTGYTDAAGNTAGTVSATVTQARAAIHGLTQVDASVLTDGSATVGVITHSGMIGEVNAASPAGTTDPNNRIQLTTTGGAANMPVEFRASGASQVFGIELTNNTRTNGKAITYVQDGAGILQVQAVNQGAEWNGVTVVVAHSATLTNATYDASTKTLTAYRNQATETTAHLATRITATGLFTGTALVTGAIANGANAVTADGATYDGVVVNLATDSNGLVTTTAEELIDAINDSVALNSVGIAAGHVFSSDGSGTAATGTLTLAAYGVTATNDYAIGTTYNTSAATGTLTVEAKVAGAAYNNVKIVLYDDPTVSAAANNEFATYDAAQKILTFHVESGVSTANNVAAHFLTGSGTASSVKNLFTVTGGGVGAVADTDVGWLRDGVTYSGTSLGGIGSDGNFDAGQVVGTGGLNILSTDYGSAEFVSVKSIEGTFTTVNTAGAASTRESGTDIIARINGILAVGEGLQASISTSALDLSVWVASAVTAGTTSSFTITGGGAQFQLGPEVVSNQQARMGISSMSTATLGGNTGHGRLFEIRSGNDHSLTTDTTGAATIVEDVITQVTTLRGRLGAFQKTTLQTNIDALSDTLEALTDAESSIRDADFAAESANLTRAQILVQSGISVLTIANQNPQNVLALLR